MTTIPTAIYTAEGVRALDTAAIVDCGVPAYTLMHRAGRAAYRLSLERWPGAGRLLVLCGAGNNAGDGYVFARLAQSQRKAVTVMALSDPAKLTGAAETAWREFRATGGREIEWNPSLLARAELIVDALLGTGLNKDLGGQYREAVDAVNDTAVPVLALDIPTGLDADNGQPRGIAIRADATMTFVGLKLGLLIGEGPEHAGEVAFDGLQIPPAAVAAVAPVLRRLNGRLTAQALPRRPRQAHKGDHGRVWVLGGNHGMAGAARLAGEAALRGGAGLVTVATRPEHISGLLAGRPELMVRATPDPAELKTALTNCDVIALGPGLGTDDWAQAMFDVALASPAEKIVDADGLNLLARAPQKRADWILTPHPGEAARLLDTSVAEVQSDRVGAVSALTDKFGGVVVLKGAATLVASAGDQLPSLCAYGNPGMATAGMGDVLTGLTAALRGQIANPLQAASAAVYVHARAGDSAAIRGERGLLASDVLQEMRPWLNPQPA